MTSLIVLTYVIDTKRSESGGGGGGVEGGEQMVITMALKNEQSVD